VNRKQVIILLITVTLLLLGAKLVLNYFGSFQTIKINNLRSGETFYLYKSLGESEGNSYRKQDLVIKASGSGNYHVKRGQYVYVVSGGKDYVDFTQTLTADKTPVNLELPSLDFTDKKLASLLSVEEPNIRQVLAEKYPFQMQQYSVQKGHLYKQGQWYGAKLVPNDPANYDELRVILKKSSGKWTLISSPPEMVVSKAVYPEIPIDILNSVNNFL